MGRLDLRLVPFAPGLLLAAVVSACGSPPIRAAAPTEPAEVSAESELPAADGREVRLVGRYGPLRLDVHFGDPARAPGYVVLWVGRQPVRLGLEPRPAEERDRLLDETVEVRGLFQLRAPPRTGSELDAAVAALPILIPVMSPRVVPQADALNLPLSTPILLPGN